MINRNVRFVDLATKPLTESIVPKNRKPRFDVTLRIIDLNNVPLVSGHAYVKWHLPSSAVAEHRGRTEKAPIKDHKVAWDYESAFGVRLVIDKSGILHDSEIHFEVIQEYSSGARADRITLGLVKINLAEHADSADDELDEGGGTITRRYLMQDSKINSTVKIGFTMRQVDGDRNFMCPERKSAAVFGGIAGIMTNSESVDPNGSDEGLPSSMSNPKSRDFTEMQDMYRKTLAASWSSHMHELPADQCIEDIFSGGDGWGKHADGRLPGDVPPAASNRMHTGSIGPGRFGAGAGGGGGGGGGGNGISSRHHSGFAKYLTHKRESSKDYNVYGTRSDSASTRSSGNGAGGANDTNDTNSQSSGSEESRNPSSRLREISEFELIDDMSSWRISDRAGRLAPFGVAKTAGKVA